MPNLTQPKKLTQYGHARDSQKNKVYTAERAIHNENHRGSPELQDIKACQVFVDDICAQAWFQRRWGRKYIVVKAGRGGGHADHLTSSITLGTWARQPAIICHEIAHVLHLGRYANEKDAPHGPEFCGVLLTLVEHVMGADARWKLSDSYRKHRVRWNSSAVPAPTRQVVTKAERQAKKVAAKNRPPTSAEMRQAADVIRRAATTGHFGPSGRKPRVHALETARRLT